jgi:hypothetical protein
MKEKLDAVGGEFAEHACRICNTLITHGATTKRRPLPVPTLLMRSRAMRIRQDVAVFSSRKLSIAVDSGSDTVSTSTSATEDSDTDEILSSTSNE